jgi:hypothetical protein
MMLAQWGVFARSHGREIVAFLGNREDACAFAKRDTRLAVRRASAADEAAFLAQWNEDVEREAQKPRVDVERAKYHTVYHIFGPKGTVEAEIEKVCADYPPAGYGTFVKSLVEENGTWVARVWRSNSCD